jgi:secondary thiamine-phosphate synthase enzyme
MIAREECVVETPGRSTQDVTGRVADIVRRSGVSAGLCHVFCLHTSASLLITENADSDVRRDLETLIARVAPDGDSDYLHVTEGPDDMSAHMRTMLTGSELTIPIMDGRLRLGTWQGVFLWEHRRVAQSRRLVVTVMGER